MQNKTKFHCYISQFTTCAAILSTDQEMIPTGDMTHEHAHELILYIVSVFAHYTLFEMLDVFTVPVVVDQSVASANSSAVVPPSPNIRPHRTTQVYALRGIISWSAVCTAINTQRKDNHHPPLQPPCFLHQRSFLYSPSVA
jgi:hypothetical protein